MSSGRLVKVASDIEPLLVREPDAARYLGVSQEAIRAWRRQKKLRATKLGRVVAYVLEDLRRFALERLEGDEQ